MKYKIVLRGNPLSTNHIYKVASKPFPRAYLCQEGACRKADYANQASEQFKSNPIELPLKVDIKVYFGDRRIRDWDNYHKLSMDALSGVVFVDDSQIMRAKVEKLYDKENPRIEMVFEVIEPKQDLLA